MEETTGFGTTTAIQRHETAALAVAEQAKAAVQARYVMAMQRPRDWDDVRTRILKDCKRPGFAATAKYSVPRAGQKIVGPSIRFAESAARAMGNVLLEQSTIYEDDDKRIVRVTATDLEANLTYHQDVSVAKTVERSRVKDGQAILAERVNSFGKRVFIVEATDDELRMKEAAQVSRAIRGMALRLLPGDILEEAMSAVDRTNDSDTKADPDAARKKMIDAFAAINVSASDLRQYLGVELGKASPVDMRELRELYQAIRDGQTTWRDAIAEKVVEGPTTVLPPEQEGKRVSLRQPGEDG